MNARSLLVLQILLWMVCAFHVAIGAGLNVSPAFPQFMAGQYGAEVNFTPALLYLLKPLGAFMLAVGFMAGVAARNPLGNRAIIYGLVLLFTLRGLQRIVFQEEIASALSVAASRNIFNAVFFLFLGLALIALLRIADKETQS